MIHGFIRACAVSPALRVADCAYNARMTIEAMQRAAKSGVQLAVFPELGLTGYTCGDLFLQQPLQKAAEAALCDILDASRELELAPRHAERAVCRSDRAAWHKAAVPLRVHARLYARGRDL